MAKRETPKKQFSIEDLMNLYVAYLFDVGNIKSERTAKVYRQQIEYFFSENSSYFGYMSTQEKNFLGLLSKLLCTNKYEGKYYDRKKEELHIDRNKKELPESDGLIIINDICKGIDTHFFKKVDKYDKTKQNLRSYVRKFFKFIKVVSGQKKIDNNNYEKFYSSKKFKDEYSQPKLTPADIAVLSGKDGEIYLHSVLFTKFKSRLRCQDRTSGDKIWLPLRFIAKVYSKAKKDYDANNKNTMENQFSKWLDKLVDDIYIHYVENKNAENEKVEKVRFGGEEGKKDVHLLLEPIDNGIPPEEFEVYVRWIDNNSKVIRRRVLTPTGRGNEKKEMVVSGIQDIAIDHVKPIDQTLRELESKGGLKTLKIVSDYYKELCEDDQLKEGNAVTNLLKKYENFVEKLTNDLNNIHDDSILRLMDSKLNTQKSNGSTFKKIVKDGTNYYGIIEEDIIADDILDKENSRVVLYQKLDNQMSSNGKLRIIGEISYKGEVKEKDDLVSILNCI